MTTSASSSPGTMPARNARPMDRLAVVASTTIMMLGGMIGPSVPDAAIRPAEKSMS